MNLFNASYSSNPTNSAPFCCAWLRPGFSVTSEELQKLKTFLKLLINFRFLWHLRVEFHVFLWRHSLPAIDWFKSGRETIPVLVIQALLLFVFGCHSGRFLSLFAWFIQLDCLRFIWKFNLYWKFMGEFRCVSQSSTLFDQRLCGKRIVVMYVVNLKWWLGRDGTWEGWGRIMSIK